MDLFIDKTTGQQLQGRITNDILDDEHALIGYEVMIDQQNPNLFSYVIILLSQWNYANPKEK